MANSIYPHSISSIQKIEKQLFYEIDAFIFSIDYFFNDKIELLNSYGLLSHR